MAKKSLSTSKLACHPPAASAHRQLLANHIIFRRGPSRCTTYSSRGLSLHQEVTAPKRVTFKSLFGNLIFIAFVAKGLFRLEWFRVLYYENNKLKEELENKLSQ